MTVCVLSLFLIACGTEPPAIQQIYWQLNLLADYSNNTIRESLSVFLQIDDADGLDDIEKIVIFIDDYELFWELSGDSLEKKEQNALSWLGANSVTMPNLEALPRSSYTIRVYDYAGKTDERSITLASEKNIALDYALPKVNIDGNNIIINSRHSNPQLWFYSGDSQFVTAVELISNYVDYKDILSGSKAAFFKVYLYDNTCGCGLIYGDFNLKN